MVPQRVTSRRGIRDLWQPDTNEGARELLLSLSPSFILGQMIITQDLVTCACARMRTEMHSIGNFRFRCPLCSLTIQLRIKIAPEEWYRNECGDTSRDYPFCEPCNFGMRYSGPGYDFHSDSYFMDCAFYCPRNDSHVVGAYFKPISNEEWNTANESATQNLINLALESILLDVPSAADKAELISATPDGGILVDISRLSEEHKQNVADACKYYEHAGLLFNLTIRENKIGFVPDKRLSGSLHTARLATIHKPHLDQ